MDRGYISILMQQPTVVCAAAAEVSLDRLCILNNSEVVVLSLTLCTDLPVEEGSEKWDSPFRDQ